MEETIRIGHWTVWPQRDLIEGPGETVHITPKSMGVLECLVRAQGNVVARSEILDTVWPGADVTDDVLTQCVTELRRAFGDSPQNPTVIETIPRKGLRLMQEVTSPDQDRSGDTGAWPTQSSSEFRFGPLVAVLLIAALVALVYGVARDADDPTATTDTNSTIAVMPFVDMSQNQDQAHLTDGLAEEMVLRLSRLEGLTVFGPRSASILTGLDDPREAAAELAVDFILDGSLRRSGDELRIVASVVARGDSTPVWAHTFERRFSDVLVIQDRIADSVALALSVELDVGHQHLNIWATSNPDAYEEALLGDHLFDFNPAHMEQARRHFTRATALDPTFIAAWLLLAQVNNVPIFNAMSAEHEEMRRISESAIEKAIALAPESVDVLLVASEVHFNARNWIEARRFYDRALEKGAIREGETYTHAVLPHVHFNMLYKLGHVAAQIELLEDAYRLRPYDRNYSAFLPQAYLAAGRVEDALREVELAYADPSARYVISQMGLSTALSIGDTELIEVWLQRALQLMPARPNDILVDMYNLLGEREAALELLQNYKAVDAYSYYNVMQWASYYGDEDLALEAMRRSGDLWSFWLPLFEPVRATPEFKELVTDMGLVAYWREFGWGDYCRPVSEDDFECV